VLLARAAAAAAPKAALELPAVLQLLHNGPAAPLQWDATCCQQHQVTPPKLLHNTAKTLAAPNQTAAAAAPAPACLPAHSAANLLQFQLLPVCNLLQCPIQRLLL
jgi:hypothetical protein